MNNPVTNAIRHKLLIASFALVAILTYAGEGKATTVGICNPDAPAQCTASVSLSGNVLTITLTNTTPGPDSGFITAAAFNFTAGTVVNNFSSTNANFVIFGPAPTGWTGSVAPDGTRSHLISATGNDYLGGGSPNGGVGGGASVTFTVTLASLNGNTEASIFASMLIRSRGFDGNPDSDKDALTPSTPVPEPTTMLLLGTGLVGTAAGIRRRRNHRH